MRSPDSKIWENAHLHFEKGHKLYCIWENAHLSSDLFIVELAYTLHATEKSDVYSFGVVLLELLTCRSPTDPQFDHNKDLVSWAKKHHLNQDLSGILDPRVSTYAQDDMRKIMEIAVRCTNESPSLRPTMVEVVNMLIDACPRVLVENTK